MLNNKPIPEELAFLSEMMGNRATQYREAKWLTSDFDADLWHCEIGKDYQFKINFRVKLDDGSLLTEPRHSHLLDTFKFWLCVQTHFDATGGRLNGDRTILQQLRRVLWLIDYFLINSAQFGLAVSGFQALTENDFRGLLFDLSTSNRVANSIYKWPERLQFYLKQQIDGLDDEKFQSILDIVPLLGASICHTDDRFLEFTDMEVIRARAWLWANGFYKYEKQYGSFHAPNTVRLATIIYEDTLWGKCKKPSPPELGLMSGDRFKSEYQAVSVHTHIEERLSEKILFSYRSSLRSLGLLTEAGISVPIHALRALDNNAVHQALNLKADGRFRTLPQGVVLSSLRNAIEFAIEFGDEIVSACIALIGAARMEGVSIQRYSMSHCITPLIPAKLRENGVTVWSLARQPGGTQVTATSGHATLYFQQFRANNGLWELVRVLFGAVQICVGALMARRQGELLDLVVGQCLDVSKTRLVFFNRKSGMLGKREKEARPIPKLAVQMILQLERLHLGFKKNGGSNDKTYLFSYPSCLGDRFVELNDSRFNESIDYFCDYFETPLDSKGHRYYIRQHQLRRFFAMLFFWGSSFGGMDTLRWFLGHTDTSHLYHYITESTPGDILRSVKANFAGLVLKQRPTEAPDLAELVEKRFGTSKFSVLDSDELDEYVEELMIEGRVEIEPEFFEASEGNGYRILIKVTPNGVGS
ncbi:MAG: hypothetical protein WCI11_19925 [Candidatus Methylumidiphilus sp.]